MMLDDIETYPLRPGHKAKTGPSAEAAASMQRDSATLRSDCLRWIIQHGDSTADECADGLGESVLSIRPRFTEMLRLGEIMDSGERRKNRSNRSATVWRVPS